MSEFTAPVAKTDPVTEPTISRRPNTARRVRLLAAVTSAALLAGCVAESTVSGKALPDTAATTSVEPMPTASRVPKTTEAAPTTTTSETIETTSATAQIETQPTLCDKANALGITKRLGEASCSKVADDAYFVNPIDGAHWQSSHGSMDVKVFPGASGSENSNTFAVPPSYGAKTIQLEVRKPYGLEINTQCSPEACYALDEASKAYDGRVIYEVAGGASQAENLAVLGQLANMAAN
jgi:hypothetical protein